MSFEKLNSEDEASNKFVDKVERKLRTGLEEIEGDYKDAAEIIHRNLINLLEEHGLEIPADLPNGIATPRAFRNYDRTALVESIAHAIQNKK